MASRLREPFGKAGLIVAIVALVAALVGGAYAANTSGKRQHKKKNNAGLNSKQKKQVKSIAKTEAQKLQGTGPAGPQGPAGSNGNDGSNGSNGSNGADGKEGPQGKQGNQGIQGIQGIQGPEGSPWTDGGTLPSEETETGVWSFPQVGYEFTSAFTPISYPIPLAEPSEHVVKLTKAETANSTTVPIEGCEYDNADPEARPVAPPGTLCVFTTQENAEGGSLVAIVSPASEPFAIGDSTSGALVKGNAFAYGTTEELGIFELGGVWAVTAK